MSETKYRPHTNEAMRQASGNVASSDPLVAFLYDLLIGHVPAGELERIVRDAEAYAERPRRRDESIAYSNGWVAGYAVHLAARVRKIAGAAVGSEHPRKEDTRDLRGHLKRMHPEKIINECNVP